MRPPAAAMILAGPPVIPVQRKRPLPRHSRAARSRRAVTFGGKQGNFSAKGRPCAVPPPRLRQPDRRMPAVRAGRRPAFNASRVRPRRSCTGGRRIRPSVENRSISGQLRCVSRLRHLQVIGGRPGPGHPAVRADPGRPAAGAGRRPPRHPDLAEQPRLCLPVRGRPGPGHPAVRADPGRLRAGAGRRPPRTKTVRANLAAAHQHPQ